MPYISESGRDALRRYKYRSSASGLMDPVMNHLWEFVVQFLPLWMAPNLVTFLGLLAFQIPFSLMLWVDRHLKSYPPPWLCLLFAAGLFFYQTLDAIDGKQARRTRTSSPLGQLFDHGCDAFNFIPMLISGATVMHFHPSPLTQSVISLAAFVFYMMNWRARHEGVMTFGVFSVTESQLLLMIVFLISAFVPHIWVTSLTTFDLPSSVPIPFDLFSHHIRLTPAILVYVGLVGMGIFTGVGEFIAVRQYYGENPKLRDPGSWKELWHMSVFIFGTAAWNLQNGIFKQYTWEYIVINTFLFSALVHRLIVADVTHEKAKPFHFIYIPVFIVGTLSILQYFGFGSLVDELFSRLALVTKGHVSALDSMPLVYFIMFWVVALWFGYVHGVISEICEVCGIDLFKIPHPDDDKTE